MKKSIAIILISFFYVYSASGQTLNRTNLYNINPYYYAPIVNNIEEGIFSYASYNSRFSGLDDAPQTISFGLYSDLGDKMGAGLRLFNDSRGIFESLYANATYQYQVIFPESHQLTFGLSAGIVDRNIQQDQIDSDLLQDPLLRDGAYNTTNFNTGFAVDYRYNNIHLLVSFPELVEQDYGFQDNLFIQTDYTFHNPGSDFTFQPTAAYYQLPNQEQLYDGSLNVSWREMIWIQPGYRSNGEVFAALGLKAGNFEVAYAYQSNNSNSRELARSGNELALYFRFKKKNKEILPQLGNDDFEPLVDSLSQLSATYILRLTALMERFDELSVKQDKILEKLDQSGEDKEEEIPEIQTMSISNVAPGNYIVISSFREETEAKSAQRMLTENQFRVNIAYDEEKGFYYLYSFQTDDREEAIKKMQQLRRSGLNEAWVLVIK